MKVIMDMSVYMHASYYSLPKEQDPAYDSQYMTNYISEVLSSAAGVYYPVGSEVWLAIDGVSWRKRGNDAYKATRKYDDRWMQYKKACKAAAYTLEQNGIVAGKLSAAGAEADDMIARFCDWCAPESVVILTADKDLTQLCCDRILCADTIRRRVFYGGAKNLTDLDYAIAFTNNDIRRDNYTSNNIRVIDTNGTEVLLDKIMRGDASDNIKPSVKRRYKTGREVKCNDNDVHEVMMLLSSVTPHSILSAVKEHLSYSKDLVLDEDCLLNNYRMIVLSDINIYPDDVKKAIDKTFEFM